MPWSIIPFKSAPEISPITDIDSSSSARNTAANTLGELGDKRAVEPLINALLNAEERNGDVRQSAAKTLAELGDQRAVEPLINALNNKKWEIRHSATIALGELGDQRAVEPLSCQACGDENEIAH